MIIAANAALTGSYDYGEVARSILTDIAATYAALDHAGRVTAASGRAPWLAGGAAIAIGIGICETHLKTLLAFRLPGKRADDELRRQKEVFQKIFENLPLMIAFFGHARHVELVNPQWERTMGWTLKELREQDVDIFAETYPDPKYRQMVRDFV